MKNYIEFLKQQNVKLYSKNNEKNSIDNSINLLNKLIANETVDATGLNLFNEYINNLPSTYDKNTLAFVTILNQGKIPLNQLQKDVCLSLVSELKDKSNDIEKNIQNQIKDNEILIDKLSNDGIFSDLYLLKDSFVKYNVSLKDQLEILHEVIKHNYEYEEGLNLVIGDNSKVLNDDDLKELLNRFGVDFTTLSDTNKQYFRRKGNIAKMEGTLISLERFADNNLAGKDICESDEDLFTRIIINSSESIIQSVEKTCKENEIDFIGFIKDNLDVLIPNNSRMPLIRKQSGVTSKPGYSGSYNNFIENIKFFKEKGYNVPQIAARNITVLTASHVIVKNNFEMLTEIYNITPNYEALTGILHSDAITSVDRFIEANEKGLEYVSINQSKMYYVSPDLFWKLKIAYLYPKDEMVAHNVHTTGLYDVPGIQPYKYRNNKLCISSYFTKTGPKTKEEASKILDFYSLPSANNKTEESKISNYEMFDANNSMEGIANLLELNLKTGFKPSIDEGLLTNPYIDFFEKNYKVDHYTYVINNTRISRIKFLRICDLCRKSDIELNQQLLNYALSYGSLLIVKDITDINNATKEATDSIRKM